MHSITQEIFRYKSLVIKLVVKSEFIGLKTWKSKTSDNWYTEGKYSAYIVLSYNKYNKDDKSKNVNESVYFSVPHMYSLKAAFTKIAQRLTEPKYSKEIFDELDDPDHGFLMAVSEKYSNYGTKAWGADKNIVLSFDVYENDAKNTIEKGVRINIITEGTSVFVPTDIFMSIDLLIQEFNLQTNSLLLFNSYLCSKASKSSSAGRKAVTEQEE